MLGFGSKNTRAQSRKRLGEFLVEQGCLSPEDLKKALAQQNREGGLLGDILVKSNLVGQEVLFAYLLKLYGRDAVGLLDFRINEQAVSLIPEEHCLKYCMLPIDKLGRILTIAMVDPLDTEALEKARAYCPDVRFRPVPCTWEDFQVVSRRIYKKEIQKPAGLENRYGHLEAVQLPAPRHDGKPSAPPAPVGSLNLNEDYDVQPLAGDVDDYKGESAVFETPEFDDSEFSHSGSRAIGASNAPAITAADFAAGIQELAASVRHSIESAVSVLVPAAPKMKQEPGAISAEQVTAAVREALEYTVSAFAEELRHERTLLLEQLGSARTPEPVESGPSPAAVAEMVGDRLSTSVQQALESVAGQLQQVGAAIRDQAGTREHQVPASEITAALQTAVTEAARQSADSITASLKTLLAPKADAPAPADPMKMAAMIRDGVGEVMGSALEAMSGQIRALAEAHREQIASLPPPADFQAAARGLQDQLTAGLDGRLKLLSDHLQSLLEQKRTDGGENIDRLAGTIQEGILAAVAANGNAQTAQQELLVNSMRENILAALAANGNAQTAQQELLVNSMRENILAALAANGSTQAAQQEVLVNSMRENVLAALAANGSTQAAQQEVLVNSMRENVLAALAANGNAQTAQQELLVNAMRENILAVLAANGSTQAAQQERLAQIVESTLTALAANGNAQAAQQGQFADTLRESVLAALAANGGTQAAQQGQLADIVRESVLAALDANGSTQAAQQERLAQIVESTLTALAGNKDAQQQELARLAGAMLQSVETERTAQSEKQEQLAQIAQAALESVRQTAQLIEAHTVAENNRGDLMRRRQSQHASVTPLNPEGAVNPELYAAEDSKVRGGLDSEHPVTSLTFANFFAGEANAFTVNLARAVAREPGGEYNPLFLYGAVGLGKTHLISAIGNEILARAGNDKKRPPARVGYVSASQFARRLAAAAADDSLELFRDNYCHWDVLILDDIQFLGGRVEAQEEFFHIFNVLLQSGRQIVIAGDKPPDRLGLLEQRLVSRFASGIVVEVKPPEWETRMKILRHLSEEAKTPVPEDILSLIALRVADDIRKMAGALRKIIAYARLQGDKVSMEEAQNILSHLNANEAA